MLYHLTFVLPDGREDQQLSRAGPRDDAAAIRQGCYQAVRAGAYLARVKALRSCWRREVVWRWDAAATTRWDRVGTGLEPGVLLS